MQNNIINIVFLPEIFLSISTLALLLIGVFQKNFLVAILASVGIILGAAYMLWLYKRVIFGRVANSEVKELKDIEKTEFYILYLLAGLIIFFGFYPDPLFNTIDTSVNNLINNYYYF